MVKIYGPYINKESRKFIIFYDTETKVKKSLAYAKYLMQEYLGRELSREEEVDHINRDKTDDRIENLQILTPKEHRIKDSKRVKVIEVNCIRCNLLLIRKPSQIRRNSFKGMAGPFCRSCAGLYGTDVQNNKSGKLPAQPTAKSEYFYNK